MSGFPVVKDPVAGVNSLHAIEYPGTGNSSVKAHGNQIKVSSSQSLFCKKSFYQHVGLAASFAAFHVWTTAKAGITVLNLLAFFTPLLGDGSCPA